MKIGHQGNNLGGNKVDLTSADSGYFMSQILKHRSGENGASGQQSWWE